MRWAMACAMPLTPIEVMMENTLDIIQDIILEARNVAVSFKVEGGVVDAVKNVNFALRKGETIAIVGESGSGKSVTARAVMRLLTKRATVAKGATIVMAGQDILKLRENEMRKLRGSRISMIFQEPMSSLNPVYTIGSQICEVLHLHNKISRADARAKVVELLREVQIPDPESRVKQYPHQLSGGQRQRVMIAMALANRPDILIADEPTTALDVTVQAQILNLIKDLKTKYGMAVILITHDLTVVRQFADRVYVMQHGEVKEHNTAKALFDHPQHPYTKRLLSSDPKGIASPLVGKQPSILVGNNVRVTYTLKKGGLFNATYHPLQAVDGLSLDLKRGESLGLVGESGSGKTTFGQALIRLLDPQEGEISFDGNRIEKLDRDGLRPFRSRMQIVFQDPFSSMNPRMNVRQIIEEGLIVNRIGSGDADRLERVKTALADAGMPTDILQRFPHEFSGGQRQRLAIARAIAMEPEFIMLDEPTSALDLSVQAQIIELLRKLQRERGLSYLFISHDLKVVRALCHRVLVMQNGKIVEQGPVAEVLTNPQTEYTRRLVKAAFEIAA
jgi:peptide/nickel transport system ATP-binding protein